MTVIVKRTVEMPANVPIRLPNTVDAGTLDIGRDQDVYMAAMGCSKGAMVWIKLPEALQKPFKLLLFMPDVYHLLNLVKTASLTVSAPGATEKEVFLAGSGRPVALTGSMLKSAVDNVLLGPDGGGGAEFQFSFGGRASMAL